MIKFEGDIQNQTAEDAICHAQHPININNTGVSLARLNWRSSRVHEKPFH
jgi:hypothetical protein